MNQGNFSHIFRKFYFLSRPRRFGKSLLISTLQHLFEGRKDLFKELWIENADWDWTPHPVLNFDFSEIDHDSPQTLRQSLIAKLQALGEKAGVRPQHAMLRTCFSDLIIRLFEKHGQKVAVLIDEYDQPLITHLGKGEEALEIAKQNRDVLREFFGVLKGGNVNEALQFVFLTGISKFARVSIFSELNNLNDLTMQDPYSAILGYTDEELRQHFDEHIKQLSTRLNMPVEETFRQIRDWYNGYRFSDLDLKVYNPFSALKLLDQSKFQSYWFETATPSFLVNLIKEKKYPIPDIENLAIRSTSFSTYDLDNLRLEPLLFQTGYITIKDYDSVLYQLGYPNQEVKSSFLNCLYDAMVEVADTPVNEQLSRLHQYWEREELDHFIETANAILAAISYPHISGQDEHYYHTVFCLMLAASGVLVPTEVFTSGGRIDMEVYFPKLLYVVELKCNQSAEQAIAQIKAKKYFEKHLQRGRKILLLGINFNTRDCASGPGLA